MLPQEGQREAGRHAVHVLAGQTALDVLVEPFYQIIEGGLFAGLAPVAVNAEQRYALKPVPVIHIVVAVAGRKGFLIVFIHNAVEDFAGKRQKLVAVKFHRRVPPVRLFRAWRGRVFSWKNAFRPCGRWANSRWRTA